MSEEPRKSFQQSADEKPVSLGREIVEMLMHNKKWWMIPIIVVLLIFGVLLILGAAPGVAPFIYTLF